MRFTRRFWDGVRCAWLVQRGTPYCVYAFKLSYGENKKSDYGRTANNKYSWFICL